MDPKDPTPKSPTPKTQPEQVEIKYVGCKVDYSSFTRPNFNKPVLFKNKVATVPESLGKAMVLKYPRTFALASGEISEDPKLPEV